MKQSFYYGLNPSERKRIVKIMIEFSDSDADDLGDGAVVTKKMFREVESIIKGKFYTGSF